MLPDNPDRSDDKRSPFAVGVVCEQEQNEVRHPCGAQQQKVDGGGHAEFNDSHVAIRSIVVEVVGQERVEGIEQPRDAR